MFTIPSTACFNNAFKNSGMHPTAKRLIDAIHAITKGKVDGEKSPGDVAQALGQSSATITNWKTRGVSKEGRLKAHTVYGISPTWVETGAGSMFDGLHVFSANTSNVEAAPAMRERKGIPVVGEVKGGDDGYLEELQYPVGHGESVVDYPTDDPNAYALRVRGDSMHPRYRAGEFIVVEPSIEPQTGDDVVVSLSDGRKLLKELNWRRDGEVQLLSVNNHFGPLTLQESTVQFIHLVAGRVRRSAFKKS